MQLRKGLRGLAAVGLSAATLLSLCISGVANADNVPISGATGKITVTNAQAGHDLVPVKLADYQAAQADSNGLTNVAFTTVGDPVKTWINSAAVSANGGSAITGDPMNWVATNMNDSNVTPWSGKLRTFVTQLVSDHRDQLLAYGLTPKSFTPPTGSTVKKGDVVFNVTPGIYLIIDKTAATAGASSAIPMLVASTLNTYESLNGSPIGTVVMKNDDISLEKKLLKVNGSLPVKDQQFKVGDILTYTLTTKGPNLVGYKTPYYFHVQDYPSKGLQFDKTVSVTAGTETLPVQTTDVRQGDSLTKHYIDWNLSNYIRQDFYGKDIVVTYTLRIAEGGTQTNAASLFTPANPATPPTNPNEPPDLDNPDTNHITETPANPSHPDGGNNNVPTNPVINPFNLKFKHFVKDSSPLQSVSGAKYKVYNVSNANSQLGFVSTSEGWVNTTGGTGPNIVTEITVPSTGTLNVKGLSAGTYKFDMTSPATNSPFPLQHTFQVTVDSDGNFTNTADVWGLVVANSITTQDHILGELNVPDAATASQLPLTGGAGIILVVALAVLAGGAVVVTSVIRRRALMTAKK